MSGLPAYVQRAPRAGECMCARSTAAGEGWTDEDCPRHGRTEETGPAVCCRAGLPGGDPCDGCPVVRA